MFDAQKPHPLLAQVPLTVSPFLSIPTAVTLPYTFRSVPSSLPASVLSETSNGESAKYVKSTSGHAANPEDIIKSCKSLQKHISQSFDDAEQRVKSWNEKVTERDLAEKRRVAPGWLDRDEKILEPTKASSVQSEQNPQGRHLAVTNTPKGTLGHEDEELNQVFKKLSSK